MSTSQFDPNSSLAVVTLLVFLLYCQQNSVVYKTKTLYSHCLGNCNYFLFSHKVTSMHENTTYCNVNTNKKQWKFASPEENASVHVEVDFSDIDGVIVDDVGSSLGVKI